MKTPLFWTESSTLLCSNVAAASKWWIETFDCKPTDVPEDWDAVLPSDVALMLPGHDLPTILLNDVAEVRKAGYERLDDHPILFCSKLSKAHEYLQGKGVATGPLQHGGGTDFFEIRDPEGHVIEICREP
jgi:catechol 2,3-dioxygenase-like lactoylglutathione lyase family enzyme